MSLVESFVKNPVKVTVAVLLVSMFGIISLFSMPMQLTPEVQTPTLTVTTRWPGGSPQEVEQEIVREQEEQLKSVNHVVWRCDDCQICHIEHANRWFSHYATCPKCARRTLQTTRHTLVEATYERSGSLEVTRSCRRSGCGFNDVHRETIPRLERSTSSSGGGSSGFSSGSSSSSGGSFGGGSSGGGGAGRSW